MNKQTKGKQATRGAKQVLEENAETIKFYFYVIVISNLAYLSFRYFLFWQTFTTKFIILYSLTLIISSVAYYFIKYMGQPVRDETGSIISPGSDLNMQGHISEYFKDAILFSAIVNILSLLSDYFLLLLFIAPIYLFYKLWVNFLGPWFFSGANEQEQSGDEKTKPKEKKKFIRVR
jgi:hypothetical protein